MKVTNEFIQLACLVQLLAMSRDTL